MASGLYFCVQCWMYLWSAGQTNCVVRRLEYFTLSRVHKVTFSLDVCGRHEALTLVHACGGGNGRVMSYLGSCMAYVQTLACQALQLAE